MALVQIWFYALCRRHWLFLGIQWSQTLLKHAKVWALP